MKRILLILLLFINANLFSQDIKGQINYTCKQNFAFSVVNKYKMYFNKTEAFIEEYDIKTTSGKLNTEKTDEGITENYMKGRSSDKAQFFYKTSQTTFFSDVWDDEHIMIVEESPFEWQWNLVDEHKKISKFTCHKGTIHFRGRDYIAWYTDEIPLPFGPWKFKGLPGLILEVHDIDMKFHIKATKVKIKNTEQYQVPFDKSALKEAISIKEYRQQLNQLAEEDLAKISSRSSRGSGPSNYAKISDCESCKKKMLEVFDE